MGWQLEDFPFVIIIIVAVMIIITIIIIIGIDDCNGIIPFKV